MNIRFPYHFSTQGRTAESDEVQHVRDLVEQVLFTTPGERVNRPTFGSGLLQRVFASTSDGLDTATRALVQGALQEWLGDVIEVQDLQVESQDGRLQVTVSYLIRRTQTTQTVQFSRGVF